MTNGKEGEKKLYFTSFSLFTKLYLPSLNTLLLLQMHCLHCIHHTSVSFTALCVHCTVLYSTVECSKGQLIDPRSRREGTCQVKYVPNSLKPNGLMVKFSSQCSEVQCSPNVVTIVTHWTTLGHLGNPLRYL